MIKLDVSDYCHNCPYFDAVTKVIYSDGKPFETHITCANAPKCYCIKIYLKTVLKEDNNAQN